MCVEYSGAGRALRILWYCIDISARRAAEQALLENQERTRAILRTANDAFVGVDRGGRIVEWNQRAEAMFGWPREEALGRILADTIIPDSDRDPQRADVEKALDADDAGEQRVELNAVARNGSQFAVEMTVWRTGDAAHRTCNAFIRDITERRRAEAAVQQAREQAERANRAKSDFLSRMSHELRTPLNAVLGFAQLLTNDPLEAEQRDNVLQILKGGYHLLELINEVLDISRIEAGRLSLSVEPVCVREAVQHVVTLVGPLAAERHIVLVVEDIDPDDAVIADRQRLVQILMNLIANAVKYNRTGGRVTVGVHPVSPDRSRITVTDTGAGIRPDKLQRLFNPFDRLGAEATDVEGTGLGLALSRGLAEAMGASMGVETEVDRGSTFWIELARSHEPAVAAVADTFVVPLPTSTARSATLLYIEDNVSNVRLITRLLARRPTVTLLHAATGVSGVLAARDRSPDVIFLDLHLPDMSGEEVLEPVMG